MSLSGHTEEKASKQELCTAFTARLPHSLFCFVNKDILFRMIRYRDYLKNKNPEPKTPALIIMPFRSSQNRWQPQTENMWIHLSHISWGTVWNAKLNPNRFHVNILKHQHTTEIFKLPHREFGGQNYRSVFSFSVVQAHIKTTTLKQWSRKIYDCWKFIKSEIVFLGNIQTTSE